jgi:hypothetical protein
MALLSVVFVAMVYGAVAFFRYEESGQLSDAFEFVARVFGWSLVVAAASTLDILRRWWTGKTATRTHRYLIAVPLIPPTLLLLLATGMVMH